MGCKLQTDARAVLRWAGRVLAAGQAALSSCGMPDVVSPSSCSAAAAAAAVVVPYDQPEPAVVVLLEMAGACALSSSALSALPRARARAIEREPGSVDRPGELKRRLLAVAVGGDERTVGGGVEVMRARFGAWLRDFGLGEGASSPHAARFSSLAGCVGSLRGARLTTVPPLRCSLDLAADLVLSPSQTEQAARSADPPIPRVRARPPLSLTLSKSPFVSRRCTLPGRVSYPIPVACPPKPDRMPPSFLLLPLLPARERACRGGTRPPPPVPRSCESKRGLARAGAGVRGEEGARCGVSAGGGAVSAKEGGRAGGQSVGRSSERASERAEGGRL